MDDLGIGSEHLLFRAAALGRGTSDAALRRGVENGAIARVWRGVYLPAGTDERAQRHSASLERYRVVVIGASSSGGPERTVSHVSAAAMHRIPMLYPDLSKVHFTSATTGRRGGRGIIHQAALADSDVCIVDGIPVTSVARSACDVARTSTLLQAVCVLDSALRRGTTMGDLQAQLARLRRHHGVAMLRAALARTDGSSESIGETVSRFVMAESTKIPAPESQVSIDVDIGGRRTEVRGDFGWRDANGVLRVVGEFDGRFKYHRSNPFGDDRLPEEVIYEEKLREDAIRAAGPHVVRWTWGDTLRPKVLHAKVIAALQASGLIT
ncbi:hypothetical protein V1Y59_00025 [Gordonia sp. PKS22-38]|uniref:Transcriptional regulator, AbiEi antitoxin, Type IV TA system n=1 Tax=Gordonia prachuapensis TaxID=3115651 RepID=A0ABU7MMG5_9ACTN|nr:hypothetical protein [Gordonia sp. PKS22-38]